MLEDSLFLDNIILSVDSYKVTHHLQYPQNTQFVYSYFESRGGKFNEIVFFGLQYIIKRWLIGQVVTKKKIQQAKEMFKLHFSHDFFNEKGWLYILEKKDGYLPLKIRAVPEGTVVTTRNVLLTVENTDENCYWLTNYIESLIVQLWYPITVATISRNMKIIIHRHLHETSDNIDQLSLKLHDFGFRGCSSVESSAIGGAAHLINFTGSDTITSLVMLNKFYNEPMAGFSIPASEHSTITTWGRENELAAFDNMLRQFPSDSVACVSDSYDIYNACKQYWGNNLYDKIIIRDGTLVIRPDSGDPVQLLPELLEILGDKFGYNINCKNYKLLPPYIRIIQGDGIDIDTLDEICQSVRNAGWSSDNISFGCGSGLLQKHNRDTQKCAYKCSQAIINGQLIDVYKDPITDPGKTSKKGRLTLEKTESGYQTLENGLGDPNKDCLVTVFEDGKLVHEYSFKEIRENARL